MTVKWTTRLVAVLTALVLFTGVAIVDSQPAQAAGCTGSAFEGWDYDEAWYTKYAAVCSYLAVRGEYSHPIYGYLWTSYAYDYTVGNQHSDYKVVKWMSTCCRPATNADGYSSL